MKGDLVSIIIPIYNAEKCLERALISVLNQTYVDFEALLIDDGSTDDSNSICHTYANSDSRFKMFRLENGGVSRARNYGLARANGRYVIFLDSDDWLEENAVEQLVANRDRLSCDFLIASYNDIINEKKAARYICDKEISLDNSKDILQWDNCLKKATTPWAKLYLLQVINDNHICFDESIKYGEDLIFNIRYASVVKKISLCRSIVYNYSVFVEGSAQTKYFKDMSKYRIAVADTFLKLIKASDDEELFVTLLGSGIGHYGQYIYKPGAINGIKELVSYFKDKISFFVLVKQFGYIKALLIKMDFGGIIGFIIKKKNQKQKGT